MEYWSGGFDTSIEVTLFRSPSSIHLKEEIKQPEKLKSRLKLLRGVSGSFRPGVLTYLMGVSSVGKTTLMDVLVGRKTGGYIEGTISISGYPKRQDTFARISGYYEQNDIHLPNLTVYESLIFSAWLRVPADVDDQKKRDQSLSVEAALVLLAESTIQRSSLLRHFHLCFTVCKHILEMGAKVY